ncbi:MAG: RNA polymerase sigma factor RpoD/SigA [Treponema sp.]|jgi:RNA polymerase primary sigma factor|nr:RNA polymerase sigma factor RpoD/SigA [Treponema sp.]
MADKQTSNLQSYFNQIKGLRLVTHTEELELARRIKAGDREAKRRLVEANLRLVVKLVRPYQKPGILLLDLIQEGNVGLMTAVDRFDGERNVHFATYAAWWIRQSVLRFLANRQRMIRLPHRKELVLRRVQHALHSLSQGLRREPNNREISEEIGVSEKLVNTVLTIAGGVVSLDSTGDNDNSPLVNFQEDYRYSPERLFLKKNSREATMQILGKLKDREKDILIYRYQLRGGEKYTLKKLGDKMGISPETVRQIEMRALKQIRGSDGDDLRLYLNSPET